MCIHFLLVFKTSSLCNEVYDIFYQLHVNIKRINQKILHFIILVITLQHNFLVSPVNGDYNCTKPHLEITVMPEKKDLCIHWDIERIMSGDWIALYNKEFVAKQAYRNLVEFYVIKKPRGMVSMKVKYKYDVIDPRKLCLGYWAIYWRIDEKAKRPPFYKIVVSTCLKNHPNWMEHYWDILKDRPMNRLFIPGTHDAASYEGLSHNPLKKMSKWFKKTAIFSFIKHCKQEILPLVNLYALTQDQNIYDQLMFGIRYLDIRVFKSDHHYWACHGRFLMVKLQTIISDVVEFVIQTKKEVVIFDIHQLHKAGFKNEIDHEIFIYWLRRKFTYRGKPLWIEYYPDNNWSRTLSEITSSGGRIIITYCDKYYQMKYAEFLWPNVHHFWGNKQTAKHLISYLRDNISLTKYGACAAMAELTMNVRHFCYNTILYIHRHPGLREKANEIAPLIYDLFREYNMAVRTNILAVDFARSMGVVRAAMIWNERLALNRAPDEKRYCDPKHTYHDNYYQTNSMSRDDL